MTPDNELTLHDLQVYRFLMVATFLGIVVAWHALGSYIAESTVIGSLTDNYFGSLLISGIAVTGAVLFKAGAALCNNDEEERAYYSRLFKCAAVAVLAYVALVSVTFGPHHDDPLATVMAAGTAEISFADAIRTVAPYLLTGSQLAAEILSAPVLFHLATIKHLAGRKMIVAKSDTQVLHKSEIKGLNAEIVELVKEKAANDALLAFHSDAEAAAIGSAIRLHRQIKADRAHHIARASEAFMSKRFGGI